MLDIAKTKSQRRLYHMDLLRILAIYLVIFNHTGERGFMLFANRIESPIGFIYMMCSVFCKIAVPIFFMISGALLLPKQESLKQLFSKRVLRMVVVLVLISVPYYFWLHRSNGIGVSAFLTYIYENSATTALWYLYSYIALLLLLPFLRSMVTNLQPKHFIYLILSHIVLVGVLPCLEYCLWGGNTTIHESFSPVIFTSQNVFFALAGYYLEHVFDRANYNKKVMIAGILLSLAAIITTCSITYYHISIVGTNDLSQLECFFNVFICVPAMTVYFLAKYSLARIQERKITKLLSALGEAVFGVYLIEKVIRALTSSVYAMLHPIVGSFVSSLIWCFAACCLAFLVVLPFKHIPFIKRIVNKFI